MVRPKYVRPFIKKMFSTWQQTGHCRKQNSSGHHQKAVHDLVKEDAQRQNVGSLEKRYMQSYTMTKWLFFWTLQSAWFPSAVYSFSSPSSTHLHFVRNRHILCLAVLQSSFVLLLPSFPPKHLKASRFF